MSFGPLGVTLNSSILTMNDSLVHAALMGGDNSSNFSLSHPDLIGESTPLVSAANISYLVNVTADIPIHYATFMFGYVMPFLLLLTVVTNTLIVIVLAQRHMITPTNLVLLAMSISDLLTLVSPSPWYFYMYTMGHHSDILFPTSACYAFHLMTEVAPAFFHTASIWLTVLLAAQRYIYVCHPTSARSWCSVPKVHRSMTIVFLLALLHQSTRFVDRSFAPVHFEYQGASHWGCQFGTAAWVKEVTDENLYFTCYYGFRIIFVHVGPCATLVILNLLLFKALREAQKKRDLLFKENKKSECRKLRDSNCTTMMLIIVVTVFLATETPLAVCTLLHVTQNALNITIADYDILNSTILFTNFFIMLTYPVNFAIYCGMSLQFRETFKNLFLRRPSQGSSPPGRAAFSTAVTGHRTSMVETNL